MGLRMLWYDVLMNRVMPSTSEGGGSSGTMDSLNLLMIVAVAVGISFLARYLAGRGRKK